MMTATVDLFVLEVVHGAEEVPLYEPRWLFANYADTGGLWKGENADGSGELKFCTAGVGAIIDSLFGDGPKRYGFTTDRPVTLVDYDYGKQQVFEFVPLEDPKSRHLVLRTKVMERMRMLFEKKERYNLHAFALEEFAALLRLIPPSDMANKGARSTRPMNAFLTDLDPKGRLVLPVIGTGLKYEYDVLSRACLLFQGAIVSPQCLEPP